MAVQGGRREGAGRAQCYLFEKLQLTRALMTCRCALRVSQALAGLYEPVLRAAPYLNPALRAFPQADPWVPRVMLRARIATI